MKNFVNYAWSRRSKLWKKRNVVMTALGRQIIKTQYRISGLLVNLSRSLYPGNHDASKNPGNDRNDLMKAANPFIAYEIGRLMLRPAPISTTIRETYAQCNEDIIVESLLRANLNQANRDLHSVRYLEIGGNHPVQTSSTYLLYRAWGARGFIVEANLELARRLIKIRPRDLVIQTAVSDKFDSDLTFYFHESDELSSLSLENISRFEDSNLLGSVSRIEKVPNLHINDFFDKYIDCPLDFMSIDIEGLDLPVLRALNPQRCPSVLQIECADRLLLSELKETLEPRGYTLKAMTDINVIFAQQ